MATRVAEMTQTTELTQTTRTSSGARFTCQVTAILLMAAGWGWNSGNFVQPANTTWGAIADILHVIPLVILLPLSVRFVSAAVAQTRSRGAVAGITAVAIFGILACTMFVVLGATNPDPNSVGVHTFEDWMPVIVMNSGTLLWLGTLLTARRHS